MSSKKTIAELSIEQNITMLEAIKVMDRLKMKLLIVTDKGRYLSLLSIGDIQRSIIRGDKYDSAVKNILRTEKKIRVANEDDSFSSIKETMLRFKTEFMPIISNEGNIKKLYFWNDIVGSGEPVTHLDLDLPVVIMAGGEGRRLRPITNIIPKALLPIGEKPIIQIIAERFAKLGTTKIFVSVNYKYEMIQQFFESLQEKNYSVDYIRENMPLGTAGSLHLLKNKIDSTFFVSNCDILVDQDYREVYDYHKQNHNDLTIVSALKHYPIPYGTLETGKNGQLKSLQEKPEFTLQVNTGLYILEAHLLHEIPAKKFFHITHLIKKIQQQRGKVGVFPVSEKSWTDIGKWQEYQKLFEKI